MTSSETPSQSHQHLQNAISDALESERQRLASRLQEPIISQINLIQAQLHAYEISATPESRMAFSVLSNLVRQLLQQVYDLESNLNPSTLNSLGLSAAIEALAHQERRTTGINFTLNLTPNLQRLPLYHELALFRFVQEVVESALHERNTSHMTITLSGTEHDYQLTIEENGLFRQLNRSVSEERLRSLDATVSYQQSHYGGLQTTIEILMQKAVELTERESDVMALLATGLTNKEIAFELEVKPRTIKFHLDNIYTKLGVNTRTEAVIYALQHRLTK